MRDNLPFDDFIKKQFSAYSPDVPDHIWKHIIAKRNLKPKGFWINMLKGNNLLILCIILFFGGGISYVLFSSENNSSAKNIDAEKNSSYQNVNTSEKNNNKNNPATLSKISADVNTQSPDRQKNTPQIVSDDVSLRPGNASAVKMFTPSSPKDKINNREFYSGRDELNKDQSLNPQTNTAVTSTLLFSPFRVNNARDLSGTGILNHQNIKLPDCPAIEKDAAGNKKYWEVYAGPDHAFEHYKSYGDTASANYLQKRKASTKFASAFSAGVRFTKVFNNGTSVRAGVNYTQVNEKFQYFNPNEIKYITVITTRVVIRAPGDTIYINDTLQYQQTGTRTKTTFNRYRNIDIPVVIGYELGNGKIHANINAGVIINVYSWYKGDVLDSLYQPVTITTGKGNSIYQFKNNIGVGFLGSVSVYYKITDKLHLVLEPYFRYNLSPMSKENLSLQQKNNIAGLRAGVRFDLK